MTLQIQSITLFISFLYGAFFELTLSLSSGMLYHKNYVYKIISTFVFVLLHIILYFLILQKINNGVVHIYAIISILIGYIVGYYLHRWFTFRIRK